MSASRTLAAGHSSEMGLYEVPCDKSLSGLGIGMTNELGAVGSVVYALNEFSPLFSFVIRCRFGDLIIHCRQPVRGAILFAYVVSLLHHG